MYPILIEWGDFILPAWHTFFVLGAIAAYILFVQLKKWFYPELSDRDIGNIYAFGYLGGYFGARIFSIFNDQTDVQGVGGFFVSLVSLGPMTFYGGFIGVSAVVSLYCCFNKVSIGKVADIALPAGMLGLAYGRVGCFLNGDDYGKPVGDEPTWYSVEFPNLADGMHRYPSQIIETIFCLLLVALLIALFKKSESIKNTPGFLACIAAMSYAVYRFFAEYLRGDPRGWWIEGALSTSQGVSLIVFFATAILLLRLRGRVAS